MTRIIFPVRCKRPENESIVLIAPVYLFAC